MYLRNAAALLELALCSWALQRAAAAGFTPTTTPDLVRESLLEKCGFQPRGDTTQARAHARLQAHASRWSPAGGICLACLVLLQKFCIMTTHMGHESTCCWSMDA